MVGKWGRPRLSFVNKQYSASSRPAGEAHRLASHVVLWFDKVTLQKMIIPGIPVTGTVRHVYDSDNTHATHFEVIIGKTFPGNLPDAIESITITCPDGKMPIEKEDFTYLPHNRDFWIRVPGIPQIGTYTVDVTRGKKSGGATDIQAVVKIIPLPEVRCFSPLNGSTLNSDNPAFSWKAITAESNKNAM